VPQVKLQADLADVYSVHCCTYDLHARGPPRHPCHVTEVAWAYTKQAATNDCTCLCQLSQRLDLGRREGLQKHRSRALPPRVFGLPGRCRDQQHGD